LQSWCAAVRAPCAAARSLWRAQRCGCAGVVISEHPEGGYDVFEDVPLGERGRVKVPTVGVRHGDAAALSGRAISLASLRTHCSVVTSKPPPAFWEQGSTSDR